MTRINCIPVERLTDQHLFAEFREITRVSTLAKPLRTYGQYTMGTGHIKFFYNKGEYLANRLVELQNEMDKRGIWQYTPKTYSMHPAGLNTDWQPDKLAKQTNLMRLSEKVIERPNFYRYYGKPVDVNFYISLFQNII